MQFGIALPKWLVEGNTSLWVLMTYIVVFMVILPFVVVRTYTYVHLYTYVCIPHELFTNVFILYITYISLLKKLN